MNQKVQIHLKSQSSAVLFLQEQQSKNGCAVAGTCGSIVKPSKIAGLSCNRRWAFVLILFLLTLLTENTEAQSWYNASWTFRKAITIDASKIGTGTHTNFPVLISLADSDLQARAQADADDILFTSEDGTTKLAHEIESYTSASGTLVAWVKIPSLSSSVGRTLYMYYGNAAVGSQQDRTNTWESSFRSVYHLNNAFSDATSNALNGTNVGTTNVAGKISSGRGFVRADGNDYVSISGLMGSPANVTLSAWALTNSRDNVGSQVLNIGDYLGLNSDENVRGAYGFAYFNSTWNHTQSGTQLAGVGWRYLTYTFDDAGNVQRFYINGVQVASSAFTPSISYTGLGGANTFIGGHPNNNRDFDFDGSIDEVRVASAARSAGWVLTEYNNQNAPSTFYSVGTQSCYTPPPTVVSPINYCQNASASQLTATGSNLLWGTTGTTSGSVGGTANLTTTTYVDGASANNNKKTNFTTTKGNVTITTVDYTIPVYQSVTELTLGIFDEAGNKIATSSTITTASGGWFSPTKVTSTFNYTLTNAGNYSIGISSGYGNIGSDNPNFPITEATGTINLTGVSVSGFRCFNNIQFTAPSTTSVAPTPSTATPGTTNYTVTQTVNGCVSAPATITVNVNAGPVLSQAPASGLIAQYNFSGNAADASGNGNNGTLQGAPTTTADRNGVASSAYAFNGTSQYVSTTTAYTNPANFSYVVWFKTSATTGGKLIGFGNAQTGASTSYDRHVYMTNSGQLYFGVYPGVARTINTTETYNDGQWHQVIASLSSTNGMKLYVDGVLKASDATAVSGENVTGRFRIGYDNINGWTNVPTSHYFNGTLDDISIYNRELTASEVAASYGPGSNAPVCPGQTLNLTAPTISGATYSWTGPNGFTSSAQNPSIANVTAANAGTYTVTATVNGCTSAANVVVALKAAPSATISYSGTPFCSSSNNQTVTRTGTAGGTYSSAAGLSINASTGAINPSASTPGTYTVTYTMVGAECTQTATTSVTINAAPSATISYSGSPYCTNTGTATVTRTGTSGGSYSSTAGLSINSGTGAINLSASTPGTYTVTYTIAASGGCSVYTTTTAITVNQSPALSKVPASGLITQYNFSGNATDASGNGNHGTLQGAPTATTDRFGNANAAYSFNGTSQYVSTTTSYVNPTNFTISVWFKTNTTAGGKLMGFGSAPTGVSTYRDRHIYMSSTGEIYFGVYVAAYRTIKSASGYNDNQWHQATVTMSATNGAKLYLDGVLAASNATITSGQNYTGWWRLGFDAVTAWPGASTSEYFMGGLDDAVVYSRELTSTEVGVLYGSPTGAGSNGPICPGQTLNLTATSISGASYSWTGPGGFASAAQNPSIANATAANAGTYTVVATTNGCTSTGNVNVVVKPAPAATISYTSSSFCQSSTNEEVTIDGTTGGTFSSTAGLSINASTGAVNPSTSTPGTYTVTYTMVGAECTQTTTTSVTIYSSPNASGVVTETCVGGNTGTITASASGGTAPYTYSLNGGAYQSSPLFTGLAAGMYTLNVRSNTGCIASVSVTVSPYATSTDNQNATATNTWVGHMYDGTAFDNYIGQFAEAETFNEFFGGTANCFNVVSNSLSRSILTETFSVKFRMTSTKRGLYVANLGSDDGSRLSVDNTIIYNNWVDQGFTSRPRVLMSLTGSSALLYEFYEQGGGNQVAFENLTLVLANTLSVNTSQNICVGGVGAAIGGDTYGALPTGISLSGTGYQWSYSTTPGGARIDIAGATGATYTPSASVAPFNTPGTYYIYRKAILSSANNISPNPYVATNESNAATITVTTASSATISYAGSPYCSNAGTATVSRTGTTGGTYSAPSGLVVNSATGEIDLGASTPGTYTVTYTMPASGGCAVQTATTSVTITALPAATIAYAGGPYSTTSGTATVTFSGTTGGTYSSTAGLSINSGTGAVNLGASTPGSYVVTYTIAAAGGCSIYTTTANITVLNGIKTFTGTGNFSDPARWTGGTLPMAGEDLIIDGVCTVDNNAGTDNIAYGTLTIGTAAARTLNWATGGTNRLNISELKHGSAISTLDMTGGGTLVIRESIAVSNMNFIPGAGTIEIQSSMTLLPAPAFNNLTINGTGITVRLGGTTTINGSLTISAGTFHANNFSFSIRKDWTNNSSATAFTAGTGTVTFNGTTTQTIGGTYTSTFNNLTIANTANTVGLNTNTNITGNLSVTAGTFDLENFTANRTTPGGTFLLANNTRLKIGGANAFPANFTTNTLVVASTVEYCGTDQTIASQTYGNLTLNSAGGAAVKTLPATPLTVLGNFTSAIGSGTSVAYTAGSNISIGGSVSIGVSTTFNGSSYNHTIGGNWVNNGTFNGNTSTLILNGSGTSVSGSGTQNFNNLTVAASAISFPASNITVSGNLSTTGSGGFTQAAGGTLFMTGAGKTISGEGISLNNLEVSGSVTTSEELTLTGNLSVSGSFAGGGAITMSGTAKTISGTGTLSFSTLSITGSVTTDKNFSISSGLLVSNSFTATAGTITFTGTSTLSGTANLHNVAINGTSLQLSSNSVLGIAGGLTITAGVLDVTSSAPNTVVFNGTGAQNVNAISYCHLVLSNGNTKTAMGNITVAYDITIGANTIFSALSHTLSVYGNWINNGNFSAGTSTVQFLGPAPGYLKGATTFNILTSNTSATTTLMFQNDMSAATVNMTAGIFNTGTSTLTITNTRTGNGIIWGTIRRTHAFTTGIAYAFEGPKNTITFSSVSGVNSITVYVKEGSISDFPFGGSISRVYDITVPAGTYTGTLRLHYEDNELNGNAESSMALWRYSGSTWGPVGKTGHSTTDNYIEISGLTDMTNRWTCSDNSNVVQWNGSVSSDWNTAANWTVIAGSGSRPPSASDIVNLGTIAFTHQPTISSTVTVKNIIFGSTKATTLTLANGGSLTSGDINGTWSTNATHTIEVNSQTITVNGDLSLSDGVSGHSIDLNIGSGTVNVNGSLYQTGDADISFSTGTLGIFHDFEYTSGTFNAGNGTVVYNGDHHQITAHVEYNNLTINKVGGVAAIDDTTHVQGDLSVVSGALENTSYLSIAGNVIINSGAELQDHNMVHVGGNWTNNGSYVGTGAHIKFNGTGTQIISGSTFNNLEINKPVGSSAILSGNLVILGNVTVTSGTFNLKTFSCSRAVPGGTAILADSATMIFASNNMPANFTSRFRSNASTVIADGTVAQQIIGGTYGNLILRNSGIKTIAAPITVNGNLTIENGANLDGGTQTFTLNGSWVNNGTFTPSSSTVILNGAGKTVSGVTNFNAVTVSGSYTVLNNQVYNGLLNITSTGSLSAGPTINSILHGDLLNSGVLYILGTTTFSGNVLQTMNLINAVQTVALTVTFNGTVSPQLNSTSAPQFGYLNINNTGGINPSVDWTVLYAMTVGNGASFNGGNSTHNIMGSLTNNGTITSSGVLNFMPSSAVALNIGSDFSSTGTVNFGGAGAISLSGTAGSFHNVVVANTNAAGITASADWNIDNDFTINSGSILNAGSRTYTVAGDLTNNGTINSQSSTFILSGAETQEVYSLSDFNKLTISKASDSAIFNSDITVNGSLHMLGGIVDLNNHGLLVPGKSNFAAGTINNGAITATGDNATFAGTVFGATVTATSDSLYLNGSTFNNTATLVKNGASQIVSTGGNTFNSATTITANSTGDYRMADTAPDVFNANATFINTGSNALYIANNAPGNQFNGTVTLTNTGNGSTIHSGSGPLSTSTYNGNIVLNNTATGIYFGASGGQTTLVATKTLGIGTTGFATGTLLFHGFSQLGPTPQNLTLTGTAMLKTGPATVFNGNITFRAPQVVFDGGSTFNGTSFLQKTGATDNNSAGGNTFNGATTLANSGSGNWVMGYTSGVDVFNNTLTLTNTGTAGIYPAYNTAGHEFNGNIVFNQTMAGTIAFGEGTGTAILADGKELLVGASGFSAGTLRLARLTQVGTKHQALSLTGTALLQTGPSAEFNGSVDFASPQLLLNGTIFNADALLTKKGSGTNVSTGGNIFNGVTTITNSGSGSFDLANTSPDIFNQDVTFNNTSNSRIQVGISSVGNEFNGNTTINHGGNTASLNFVLARNPGSTATFNGNLTLNCTNQNTSSGIIIGNEGTVNINGNVTVSTTSGRGVFFADVNGSVTLGSGYTITDAGEGSFTTGILRLSRFTQLGATAQNISLSETASMHIGPSSLFNGAVNFSAPQLLLNGAQYNNTAILRKTGATDNTSTGGNIYNGATTISNNGNGFLRLGNSVADTYNSDATFVQTGSGALRPSYGTSSTVAGNLSTVGTATAIGFGTTISLNGTTPQSILGTLAPTFNNLTVTNTGSTVTSGVNVNVSGNLSVSSGTFDLGMYTANRLTSGGTLSVADGAVLKIGGTNTLPSNYTTHSIGATSTIEYSGVDQSVAVPNSAQRYGHLIVSGTGTQINTNNISVRNDLTISGSLNLNTYHLKVGGAITTTGTFHAADGTMEFNGVTPQTIAAATFSGNLLKGLTINNAAGVSLGGTLNLTDVLTVSGGSVASNGHLILKSTATGTARVAPITSVAATPIIGDVIAERFVPGRRKYRLITSPVTTSSKAVLSPGEEALSIWAHWQNSGNNLAPNAGNFITGGSAADGFDTQTANASLFTYDDVNRKYKAFSSANGKNTKYTPLKAGVAYYMFVYGDRRNTVFTSNPNNTVLSAKGLLKTGNQVYNTTSEIPLSDVVGRFTLLGNPYASPIDWATIPKNDIANTMWGWDPNLSSTGGYVTVTTTGTATLTAPYSGEVGLDQYIQSGQGFYVKTTGAAPSLTIREQDKIGNFNPSAFRVFNRSGAANTAAASRTANDLPLIAINLQYTSAGTKVLADGVLAAFDNSFTKEVGAEDAVKMANSNEALSIVNGSELLSIDGRKLPSAKDSLQLNTVKLLASRQYTMQIFTKQIGGDIQVFLEDKYKQTMQPLVLNDTNAIAFSVVASEPLSSAADRFKIVFAPSVSLPVRFVSVRATEKSDDVEIAWNVAEESGIKKYEVERSSDGVQFTKVSEVLPQLGGGTQSYTWLDEQPQNGNSYYRVRAVDEDGTNFMSRIIAVNRGGAKPSVKVSPNPVQGGQIRLQLLHLEKGKYTLQILSVQGQLVSKEIIDHAGGSNTLVLGPKKLAAGVYYLQLVNEKTKYEEKIFVE